MEVNNYDMVIIKTVRDLFKSNNLNQILKYQNNKEKEFQQKDEDMKKLILDKYPFLIKSLSNLEEIYAKIPNLEELRIDFKRNSEELFLIDSNEELFSFNFGDEKTIGEINDYLLGEDEINEIGSDFFDEDNCLNKINGEFNILILFY